MNRDIVVPATIGVAVVVVIGFVLYSNAQVQKQIELERARIQAQVKQAVDQSKRGGGLAGLIGAIGQAVNIGKSIFTTGGLFDRAPAKWRAKR